MQQIDLETWPRREHFKLFSSFDHPHWGVTVNVDLTAIYPILKEKEFKITVAIVYIITRAANAVPELRQRIRGGDVIEHDIVHPSYTVLSGEDLFGFCTIEYSEDFTSFASRAGEQIEYAKEHLILKDKSGEDDLLFMSAIPWLSFTSFMHPMNLSRGDSIPRFAWGKFFQDGGRLKMPLAVQGHHALIDGIHLARYYEQVQELLDTPIFLTKSAQAQPE